MSAVCHVPTTGLAVGVGPDVVVAAAADGVAVGGAVEQPATTTMRAVAAAALARTSALRRGTGIPSRGLGGSGTGAAASKPDSQQGAGSPAGPPTRCVRLSGSR